VEASLQQLQASRPLTPTPLQQSCLHHPMTVTSIINHVVLKETKNQTSQTNIQENVQRNPEKEIGVPKKNKESKMNLLLKSKQITGEAGIQTYWDVAGGQDSSQTQVLENPPSSI